MTPRKSRYSHYAIQIAAAVLISVCWLQPVSAGQTTEVAGGAEAAARADWRAFIAHKSPEAVGCFQASYPNIAWEQVECKEVHPRVHPVPRSANGEVVVGNTVGNGQDYVAQSAGLITETLGTFPAVTGVQSEKSVGVPLFGGGGILGPNEYSLQLNSNPTGTTSACSGHLGCTVWQQFIYATDYSTPGQATVFMQYWLLNYGASCPGGWTASGGSCYTNSSGVTAPNMPITTPLSLLALSGAAASGGNDTVVFYNGTTAYSVSASDSVLDISSVWNQSEFNIVGDAGGSEAIFNAGSSITVNIALTDGSSAAPTCVANAGSTGETNNLALSTTCSTAGGSSPSIQFDEGNLAPTITSLNTATWEVGVPGSFQVTAVSDPPSTFTESGTLPPGVSLSPSGLLSGTPTVGGVYTFNITASNGVAPNATQTFTLTVNQAPIITSANHTTFTVGSYGFFQVVAAGYPTPTFTESGALPSGVSLSPSGLLSGTPAPGTGGVYTIIITAGNGILPNATQTFTLTVDQAPTITSANATTFQVGKPGSFQVTATGFPAPTFTESGALPAGVTFTSSGLLSGTPAPGTQGYYNIVITASNGVSPNATQNFTLTVALAPTITSANHTTFTVGKPGSFQVTATGFPAPTFTESGSLPSGVSFSPSGLLSGIPATGGIYTITITASNGILPNATQIFKLTVAKAHTTCVLHSSSDHFSNGEPIIFTALVTAPGTITPNGGSVSFFDNSFSWVLLGQVPLVNGMASLTAVLQAPPDRQIFEAVYSGDDSFTKCTSPYIAENYQ